MKRQKTAPHADVFGFIEMGTAGANNVMDVMIADMYGGISVRRPTA
jgi:hypothetical protein